MQQAENPKIAKKHFPNHINIMPSKVADWLTKYFCQAAEVLASQRYQAGLDNNFLFQVLSNSGLF